MRIRMRFEKGGALRFVGHLDTQRTFQKVLARAHLPVRYSEGYHPHPLLSFASPLGVGLTSTGEYLDLELEEGGTSEEMLRRINEKMPEGLCVTGLRRLPEGGRRQTNAMASVGRAKYRVKLREPHASEEGMWEERVESFLRREEIPIIRKTKKAEEIVNLRPLIYDFHYEAQRDSFYLYLSAGSRNNLRPEWVMESFLGRPCSRQDLSLCRLDLLTADGLSLGEIGEEIV